MGLPISHWDVRQWCAVLDEMLIFTPRIQGIRKEGCGYPAFSAFREVRGDKVRFWDCSYQSKEVGSKLVRWERIGQFWGNCNWFPEFQHVLRISSVSWLSFPYAKGASSTVGANQLVHKRMRILRAYIAWSVKPMSRSTVPPSICSSGNFSKLNIALFRKIMGWIAFAGMCYVCSLCIHFSQFSRGLPVTRHLS